MDEQTRKERRFLGIWFECCRVYGRIHLVKDATRYAGHCPRCLAAVSVAVAPGGSGARFFRAR